MKTIQTILAVSTLVLSVSAFADQSQAPAQILNGSKAPIDKVELVEVSTPGTQEFLPQHYLEIRVSGMFQTICAGIESLVKLQNHSSSLEDYSYTLLEASAPIHCMAIGIPQRFTFTLDQLDLPVTGSSRIPAVRVNGIEGVVAAE